MDRIALERTIDVRWNECDPAGIVFHAHFVVWMDEGFEELTRQRAPGVWARQRGESGFVGAPLLQVRCTFRAPARFGDRLTHRLVLPPFTGSRAFGVGHRFLRDDTLIADGEQTRAWCIRGEDGALSAIRLSEFENELAEKT